MVMTPTLELSDDSCSFAGLSTASLTSPASSSTRNTESPLFFSDEEMIKQLDFSTIMTPIIKDTLKETIWKRLEETGKPVPEVELRPSCTETLTKEEEDKRQIRRLRNKLAAQKCRNRKRERGDMLEQQAEQLEARRDSYQEEIERLKREQEVLQDMLDAHAPFCKKHRPCAHNTIQCLNNDHTYTLMDCTDHSSAVPSLSDVEGE
ncbi:cyclic AMP-dependent transcription factor ATF-3-like [Liolophura sinensis]|uniref:cyclic AMP-dependent transcription factor ATF-3-like n=1 Tax=Liolophura sinensis TaxID=3198878 RepID=UPI0031588771